MSYKESSLKRVGHATLPEHSRHGPWVVIWKLRTLSSWSEKDQLTQTPSAAVTRRQDQNVKCDNVVPSIPLCWYRVRLEISFSSKHTLPAQCNCFVPLQLLTVSTITAKWQSSLCNKEPLVLQLVQTRASKYASVCVCMWLCAWLLSGKQVNWSVSSFNDLLKLHSPPVRLKSHSIN